MRYSGRDRTGRWVGRWSILGSNKQTNLNEDWKKDGESVPSWSGKADEAEQNMWKINPVFQWNKEAKSGGQKNTAEIMSKDGDEGMGI